MTKPDNDGHDDPGRQRRQARTVVALGLAAGRTVEDAAAQAGVSSRTVFRWLRQPGFRRRVDAIRQRLISETVGILSSAMTQAARSLAELLTAEDARVRLAAIRTALEFGLRLRESEDLGRRIADLEARQEGAPAWR